MSAPAQYPEPSSEVSNDDLWIAAHRILKNEKFHSLRTLVPVGDELMPFVDELGRAILALRSATAATAAIDAAREQDRARAAAPQTAVGVSGEQVQAFKTAFHSARELAETCSDYDACVASGIRAVLALSPATKPEAPAADCGNCLDGETDRGHKCKVCGGTPAEAPANEGGCAHAYSLRAALACIRWNSFGEVRTPGWNAAPPTPAEAAKLIETALAAPAQGDDARYPYYELRFITQAQEAAVGPMAKMAQALREKAAAERSDFDRRVQSGEWGPMPGPETEADDLPDHVAEIEGDDAVRELRWNKRIGAFNYPVGTKLYAARQSKP